jgi:hypothetical protein
MPVPSPAYQLKAAKADAQSEAQYNKQHGTKSTIDKRSYESLQKYYSGAKPHNPGAEAHHAQMKGHLNAMNGKK